jgi:hypothetical protein
MAVILALPRLFDAVVAHFAAELAEDATPVPQAFGWREPAKRTGSTTRIVWVPGDDANGDMGEVLPAKQPGRNPRSLGTLDELFTVYIEAVDVSAYETERAQYQVVRELFDAWWRAVYLAAHGTVAIQSAGWVIEKKERRHGAALRVLCAVQAMIPDAPLELAPVDVRAVVDVEALDHEESFETAEAPPQARAATTADVTLDDEQTVDGIDLEDGDRVLVKDQTAAAENGVYVVADELEHGYFVHVVEGDENGDAGFELATEDPIVLDVTELVFERVSP